MAQLSHRLSVKQPLKFWERILIDYLQGTPPVIIWIAAKIPLKCSLSTRVQHKVLHSK